MQKYPIGIQDFEKLIENNYLYVDKTALIYKLVQEGSSYFLARPRRFGKSLLVSTLKALYEGKRHLFKGLAIDNLNWSWEPSPVVKLDLNAQNYKEGKDSLIRHLKNQISDNALRLGVRLLENEPARQLAEFIKNIHQKTDKRVVVLVDEYDKPLLETLTDESLHSDMKDVLKAFYGVLKSSDEHLEFVLLTGVTKFGQVSVFSDLNQLEDISMVRTYATLCGIPQVELEQNFSTEVYQISTDQDLSKGL